MTRLPGSSQELYADVQDQIRMVKTLGTTRWNMKMEPIPATDHPGKTALIEQIPRRLFVPKSRPRYPRPADVLLHNVPRRVSSLEIGSLEDVAATCIVSLYAVGVGNGIVVATGRWGFPSNPAEGHSLRSPIKDICPVVQKMTGNA